MTTHQFIIPAFKDSPHLGKCLISLVDQTSSSPVSIVTSTPSPHLSDISEKYNIQIVVNPILVSIGFDWNFALQVSNADWVTLAHQDDVYYPDFAAEVKKTIEAYPDAALIFTSYDEIKNDEIVSGSRLVTLKKVLLETGFWGRKTIHSTWAKTNCIRFGCAIPCPTVTLKRDPKFRFDENLKVNLDWDAWLRMAQGEGSFVWIRKSIMAHRIHDEQESISAKRTGVRHEEDLKLLKRLWPPFMAHLIEKTYRLMR